MTKILACSCKSEYQDEVWGQGNRVHNATRQHEPEPSREWRCTVCGQISKGKEFKSAVAPGKRAKFKKGGKPKKKSKSKEK